VTLKRSPRFTNLLDFGADALSDAPGPEQFASLSTRSRCTVSSPPPAQSSVSVLERQLEQPDLNTTGTITLQGKPVKKGKAFQFGVDLGGNALGCPDPAADKTPTITKGSGNNHWNAKGFKLKLNSPAHGKCNVSYSQKTQKLTGTGGNPSCAPGVTWKLDGKLTKKALTGTVTITLPSQTATSTINATRQ
jgi:hypothetical protein